MNNFQKILLTVALAWACIVIQNIAWQALGRSLLCDLSYALSPTFVGPTVLLVAALKVTFYPWEQIHLYSCYLD